MALLFVPKDSVNSPERTPHIRPASPADPVQVFPSPASQSRIAGQLDESKPHRADPLPLCPPLPDPAPYPLHALGQELGSAAAAIARKVQVPTSVAAQSVLAAAALAAQAHCDVRLPFGQRRPLSLYLVSVAGSGDRKSTADNEALWPVRKREKALREVYEGQIADWRIRQAAHAAQKRKIEGDRGLELKDRETELRHLGPEPEAPLHPLLTAPDPTVEGLARAWTLAPAALGIFSAEGGQFTGGHGMSADHRLKTAAALSELWDGRGMRRMRAGDGLTILDGRRLCLHVMLQPEAASAFLADDTLKDQGLLSRLLIAAPTSMAGTRIYKDTQPSDEAAIKAYGARILHLLEAPWPTTDGKRNELDPPELIFEPDAERLWREFFDHTERQSGPGGDLDPIRDLASKAAELVARIAGVMTVVADARADVITATSIANAALLMDWYLAEALRLAGAARLDPKLARANRLLQWLKQTGEPLCELRTVLRLGPSSLRTKATADEAVGVLVDHGWLTVESQRPRVFRVHA